MPAAVEDLDSLSERVIGCAIAVHRSLGPGLLESIYRECLILELKAEKIRVEKEIRVASLRAGLRRLHHPDVYVKKRPS